MARLLENSLVLEEITVAGYEKVVKITDEKSGLKAIICIHNTVLGPALGGTRIYPYPTFEAALTDVKRLAQGMTYKSALAGAGLGGGKSVIISDHKKKTPEMLVAFAQAIHCLNGEYTGAEDLGATLEDISFIARHTPYVVGVMHEKSSGNPSPFTAWGVFRGMQAAMKKLTNSDSLEGVTVAIQGLGNVGAPLAEFLFWHGAKLIVSDIDWDKTVNIAKKFNAEACPAEDILSAQCDIFAPCALGGVINSSTIPQLRCRVVAGSANNQLLCPEDGDLLFRRKILYAPDFIINAGGLINVTEELAPEGYNPMVARKKVDGIYGQLLQIFDIAEQNGSATSDAAISLGDYRLKYKIGKRTTPLFYHHAKHQ